MILQKFLMDWHVENVTDSYPSNVKSEKKIYSVWHFKAKFKMSLQGPLNSCKKSLEWRHETFPGVIESLHERGSGRDRDHLGVEALEDLVPVGLNVGQPAGEGFVPERLCVKA